VLVSVLGGPLVSRLGVRKLLILGAATFPINGSAYYINLKYHIQVRGSASSVKKKK
jgi:hypothetical protein